MLEYLGPGNPFYGLERHHCRWPLGDPRQADFRFCREPTQGAVYCEHHRALGTVPLRRKK